MESQVVVWVGQKCNNFLDFKTSLMDIEYRLGKSYVVALNFPVGQCSNKFTSDFAHGDQKLHQQCFCCGSVYNPDPSLNCPVNTFPQTGCSIRRDLIEFLVSTRCQKMTAVFSGTFQDPIDSLNTFDAQLELKIDARVDDKMMYFERRWGESYLHGKNISIIAFTEKTSM